MPRRTDERIVEQINDARRDLNQTVQTQAARLSREISEVGHDTERQRRELAELINTVIAGLRDDNADLRSALRAVQSDLNASRREVQQLRTDIEAQRHAAAEGAEAARLAAVEEGVADALDGGDLGLAAALGDAKADGGGGGVRAGGNGEGGQPPTGDASRAGDTGGPARGRDINDLLARAAGIAYAEVVCHRDTWAFLIERATREEHFRLPGDINEDEDGTIEADLSGRSLIAVLEALLRIQSDAEASLGTKHMAALWYERIGDALLGLAGSDETVVVRSLAGRGRTGTVIRIVIDDRHPAEARPGGETAAA